MALVTGGSRGLGFLLARELGRGGARVAICARSSEELARAARLLGSEGIDVFAWECDLTQHSAPQRFVDAVVAHYKRLDIVVNNAGIIQVGPMESMSLLDFREIMETNFWATLRVSLAAIPTLKRCRGARIVNISSIGAVVSVPHLLPYSCSKFAQLGLSLGLRAELAKDGIRVVSILPGVMRTGSFLRALFKGKRGTEFRLFSFASSSPLLTLDAERAARRIVRAIRDGENFVTLGVPFRIGRLLVALLPGASAEILGGVNRLLPRADRGDHRASASPGRELHPHRSRAELPFLRQGYRAARRFQGL